MSNLGISPGAKLVSIESVTDTTRGNSTVYKYEGSETDCRTQRLVDIALGATHTMLSPRGDGFWTLTASYPYDTDTGAAAETPADVHELDVDVSQPSVYTNPILRELLGANETALLSALKTTVEKYQSGGYGEGSAAATAAEAALQIATLEIINDLSIANVQRRAFRNIAYRGQDSYLEYRSVYRRTLSAASPLQVQASFTGVNQIWTTAELRAFEVLPSDWWFELPVDFLWHKAMPTVHTVAGQKTQIAYSYTSLLGASALFYEPYNAAELLDDDPTSDPG